MADNVGSAKQKGVKQKGELKTARIPIKIVPVDEPLRKPEWIRVKAGNSAGASAKSRPCCAKEAAHRLRRSRLPQHRRMLRQAARPPS
jgi:lipoic acid synthetase